MAGLYYKCQNVSDLKCYFITSDFKEREVQYYVTYRYAYKRG